MTRAYWLTAIALTLIGSAVIWFVEPETHADTAYALGCGIICYAGGVALFIGISMLVMNEAVERAGNRLFGFERSYPK